jgi:hypothetical protein
MAKIHELQTSFTDCIGHWDMWLTNQLCVIAGQDIDYNISNHLLSTLLNQIPDCFLGYEIHTYWLSPKFFYADLACLCDFHFFVAKSTLYEDYDEIVGKFSDNLFSPLVGLRHLSPIALCVNAQLLSCSIIVMHLCPLLYLLMENS